LECKTGFSEKAKPFKKKEQGAKKEGKVTGWSGKVGTKDGTLEIRLW